MDNSRLKTKIKAKNDNICIKYKAKSIQIGRKIKASRVRSSETIDFLPLFKF